MNLSLATSQFDTAPKRSYWTTERLEEEARRKINQERTNIKGPRKGEEWFHDETLILMKDESAIKRGEIRPP